MREKIFGYLHRIPAGRVTTYKHLAEKFNTSPRAIGKILSTNPEPIKTPCHRVIRSDGSLGGYKLGLAKKKKLLISEGIKIKNDRIDLRVYKI